MKNRLVLIIILIFIALQVPYIVRGLSGGHRWRQADTAAVSRNFYQESYNFLKPRVDLRGDKSGITGMEFPVYNYIVSVFHRIFGVWFGWGQLLSLFFSIGVAIILIKISEELKLSIKYFILLMSIFMNRLFFSYSTRFMPETISLFFGLWGVFLFFKWIKEKKFVYWFFTALLFSVSILIRPYMGVLCLPIIAYSIVKIKKFDFSGVFLGVIILIPFYIWYFIYCPYLNDLYGLNYFFMGIGLKEGLLNFLTIDLWTGMFNSLTADILGWILLPFFIVGTVVVLKNIKKYTIVEWSFILGVPVFAFLALPVVSGKSFIVHSYYLFGVIPSISIIVAIGMNRLFERWKKFSTVIIVMVVVFIANNFHTYRKDQDIKNLKMILSEIEEKSQRSDLFITDDDGRPVYLYVINRKGWSVTEEIAHDSMKLKNYYKKGADFLVRRKKNGQGSFELKNISKLLSYKGINEYR